MYFRDELCEKENDEFLLQLKHIRVKAATRVSVPLDVEKEQSSPSRRDLLRSLHEREKGMRCLVEAFVAVNNVVDCDRLVAVIKS